MTQQQLIEAISGYFFNENPVISQMAVGIFLQKMLAEADPTFLTEVKEAIEATIQQQP